MKSHHKILVTALLSVIVPGCDGYSKVENTPPPVKNPPSVELKKTEASQIGPGQEPTLGPNGEQLDLNASPDPSKEEKK